MQFFKIFFSPFQIEQGRRRSRRRSSGVGGVSVPPPPPPRRNCFFRSGDIFRQAGTVRPTRTPAWYIFLTNLKFQTQFPNPN